jgi:hypothetical protein
MRTFTITDREQLKIKVLLAHHNTTCPYGDPKKKTGAIGGRFSYVFTPTSIGTMAYIECACGEKLEFQDMWDI